MWSSISKYVTQICEEYQNRIAFQFWIQEKEKDKARLQTVTYSEFLQELIQKKEKFSKLERNVLSLVAKPTPSFFASFFAVVCSGKTPVLYENEEHRLSDTNNLSFYEKQKKGQGIILFSSGTTGRKKAVDLPLNAVFSMLETKFFSLEEKTYMACKNQFLVSVILPFHHLFGLVAVCSHLGAGDCICFHGNPKALAEEIRAVSPHIIETVPSIHSFFYKKALRLEKQGKTDFSTIFGQRLQYVVSGGAALNQELVSFFTKHEINVISGYSLTELGCVAGIKILRSSNFHNKKAQYGKKNEMNMGDSAFSYCLSPFCKGRILEGEILLHSETMMNGYVGCSKENRIPFVWLEGKKWFPTGDFGVLGEKNELFITGRRKNLIIRSNGENISPEELEAKLMELSGIEEAMVFQKADKLTGEVYGRAFLSMTEDERQIKAQLLLNEYNKQVRIEWHIATLLVRVRPFEKTSTLKLVRKEVINP